MTWLCAKTQKRKIPEFAGPAGKVGMTGGFWVWSVPLQPSNRAGTRRSQEDALGEFRAHRFRAWTRAEGLASVVARIAQPPPLTIMVSFQSPLMRPLR